MARDVQILLTPEQAVAVRLAVARRSSDLLMRFDVDSRLHFKYLTHAEKRIREAIDKHAGGSE